MILLSKRRIKWSERKVYNQKPADELNWLNLLMYIDF